MRRTLLAASLATLALPAASAHAAFFAGEVIDGPNADLVSVGDVDISREGTGGVVFIKREGGIERAYLSQITDGGFGQPGRIDPGLGAPASQPVLAASTNGRMAVAFVAGDTLWTSIKKKDQAGFTPPLAVATGGISNPSIDMSINGATYVSYTQSGDVKVARSNRDDPNFAVLPAPVDVNAGTNAGVGPDDRSRVVVSADGTALVVWGEGGPDGRTHVYARRLFELRLSAAPQELSDPGAGNADRPEVDIEDDSSYAQVTFRQISGGAPRIFMRRLVGSQFNAPEAIDNGAFGTSGRVDLTGRGEGLFGVSRAGGGVTGGTIFNNKISGIGPQDPGGTAIEAQAVPAVGENEDGVIAWFHGTEGNATVRAKSFEGVEFLKATGEAVLSKPEFGPVRTQDGMDASASRAGDVAAVFIQGGETDKRLVAGVFDKPPSRIAGSNTTRVRKLTRLSWAPSLNLLGAPFYRVVVDGKQLVDTQQTQFIPQPGQIPDGTHTWQIFIRDRRGQEVVSRTRQLRVDNTPPTLSISLKKKKREVTVTARAGDPNGAEPSGLSRVLVDWGDGKLERMGTKASRTFPSLGTKRIRVKAVDKAGNEIQVERSTRIG